MAHVKQTGLSPGGRYTVQARARSVSDPSRVSEWSNAYSFTTSNDIVPPKAPSNLVSVSKGSSFITTWTAPTQNENGTQCTDLKGYYILFKNTDNLTQVTRETFVEGPSHTLSFEENKEMFGIAHGNLTIEVKSVDQMGNRSVTPAVITVSNPRPANVTGLSATAGLESIILAWDKNTTDDDLVGYEVHMSTVSADFTPTAATRRYSGQSTGYVLPTGNPTPHYFKVRAIDIFELFSAVDATATATPKTTTSTDGTPPGGVTAITLNGSNDGTVSALRVGWTAPADLDIDHYTIRYALNTTDWSYINVPADQTSAVITNLKPGTAYYVGIQTWDFASNKSAWVNAATYPATTTKDVTAPNKPAVPTVSTGISRVQISHNMKDSAGANLATDVSRLEVHTGTSIGFTPDSTTKVTEMAYVGPGVGVNQVISFIATGNTFWKIIAVDTSGNKSTPSDGIQGNPGLITGAFIEQATITDANIQNLSAAKLVAGSAFVNDLFIRSGLTIDNANGKIQSDDYNAANQLGWKLDRDGLYLYEGTVAAKSLLIQDSQNLVTAPYADFEFADRFYFTDTNGPNPANMGYSNINVKFYKDSSAKFGNQSLRIVDTIGDAGGSYGFFTSSSNPNLDVAPGETYIYSAYIKNNLASASNLCLAAVFNGGQSAAISSFSAPVGNGFVRYQMLFTAGANTTKVSLATGTSGANAYDLSIDGIQLERRIGKLDTASPWTPPGATTINGESITTGSIRSSAPAESIPSQPAWSLNTTGGLQVGDALVRGNLTVGAGTDTTNSQVKSSDYIAGTSGWMIRGDGFVEFNKGLFRSDLLLERVTNNVTLRLKASVADNIVYTPGGPSGQVTVAQPLITGQSYGFDRTLVSGGWYTPTVPNVNKKMRFSIGPTTAKNVVIQTTDADVEGVYSTNPPDNVLLNTLTVGEQINYSQQPNIRERAGMRHLLFQRENPAAVITTQAGGTINTQNTYYNTNYVGMENNLDIRSPFVPETNNKQTSLTDFFSSAENKMQAQTSYYSPAKNLIAAPWDYSTVSGGNSFAGPTYNNAIGTASGGYAVSNANALGLTQWALPMLFDDNYRIPCILANLNPFAAATCTMWFRTTSQTSVASAPHTGIRRGRTYIFSMFMKTDLATGSGIGTSPTSSFVLNFGIRCTLTGNTTYVDAFASNSVTVLPGMAAQRISFTITIPTGTGEVTRFAPYINWPSFGSTNGDRQVAFSRPQLEEKTWANHSNPEIAASNVPTAWGTSSFNAFSENYSAIKLVTKSNSDWVYDAYGRYDPDYSTSYAAEQVKTYREAPNYLDIILNRKSLRPGVPYSNETNETVYRFSEAGIMYPGAYEPMRPSGVEATFQNRSLAPNSNTELTNFNLLATMTTYGADDIRREGNNGFKFMRTGFYVIHCGVNVPSEQDLLWMTFDLNNVPFHSQGAGRIYSAGTNTSTVKFFNRGEVFRAYMNSGPGNAATRTVEGPRIAIVRVA
jgi:hypothetical protein